MPRRKILAALLFLNSHCHAVYVITHHLVYGIVIYRHAGRLRATSHYTAAVYADTMGVLLHL